jgi:hypothetical protein
MVGEIKLCDIVGQAGIEALWSAQMVLGYMC